VIAAKFRERPYCGCGTMHNNYPLPFPWVWLLIRSSFGWFCVRLGRWVAYSLQLFCHAFVGRLTSGA